MTPVTRVYELRPGPYVHREEYQLLHEWPGHVPVIPEGGMIVVGDRCWRVRYVALAVDEAFLEMVLTYTVEDPRREAVR